MSTRVLDLETQRPGPPDEPVRFEHAARSLLIVRVSAGLLALPFVITLITGNRGLLALAALLLAFAGAWLLVHAQRRIAARPDAVIVDPEGLKVTGAGRRELRWAEMTVIRHSRLRRSVSFGTRTEPDAITFDDDLDDFAGFLDVVTQHIDASRRGDDATQPQARGDGLFRRPAYEDIVTLAASLGGIIAGLLIRPGFFVVTALALPRLIWHWLTAPHSIAVDHTAVWIIRPLARDVIPLRAIRGVGFDTYGRLSGAAVMIDHHDRGRIVLRGFNAAALPLFDAIVAARQRARAAARTGSAPPRTASGTRGADSHRSAILQAAAVLLAFSAITWITILTGIPLRTATIYGSDIVVRTALLLGAPLESSNADGLTALHLAAERNDAGIARALLSKGASVHARSTTNALTPLHEAVERGHRDVAEMLIAAGADVNARTTPGRSPLAQTALPLTPGDTAVARVLLDAGADPGSADDAGRTPLHHAARAGHVDLLRMFTRAGAAIEAADTDGDRPLHHAFAAKQQTAISALLQAGADVNAPGRAGRTVLVNAVDDTASAALINLLLDAGARADVPANDGWNAVQLAADRNNLRMLELLARRQAPVNATDGRVPPALWIAVDKGYTDAARVLLRGGASPRLRWNGRSALELAESKRNATLIALMQMR